MKTLTARQAEIVAFIRRQMADAGLPPTRAEIMQAFGFRSPNAAETHLRALARKGALELRAGASRGIRLLNEPAPSEGLPLVGRVAAGAPILSIENVVEHVAVDAGAFRPRADFLLRVRGDSMKNAGIFDRDLLAVQQTHEAHNGQIVVARLGDELTVKRFRREGSVVRLLPENDTYAPIRVDLRETELVIEGRAVGLLRMDGFGRFAA